MVALSLGSSSAHVGDLHQRLIECGYSLPMPELGAVLFGPGTLAAVEDYQARHVGPDGHALTIDGSVGPLTEWALDRHVEGDLYVAPGWASDEPKATAPVLDAALAELFARVHEDPDGSNRGPRVDLYTRPQLGIPWCAAFVSYCYRAGGAPFGRILSAWGILDWAQRSGRTLEAGAALAPGDVFVILRPVDPSTKEHHGHTGIVASILGGDRFCTVEGNASNAVRGLVRNRASITAFVRPL